MGQRVILHGSSTAFTVIFKKALEECGFEPVLKKGARHSAADEQPGDVCIYEARVQEDIEDIKRSVSFERPFLIFTDTDISRHDSDELRDAGLAGVIGPKAASEDISLFVNRAVFYRSVIKRKPRIPLSIPVAVRGPHGAVRTISSQLSRDGMFIVTLNPLPVNATCKVEFGLPHRRKKFSTSARVIYSVEINNDLNIISSPADPFRRLISHPGMAVFFIDLPEDAREELDKFIKKYC